jgi:hypothetical protein
VTVRHPTEAAPAPERAQGAKTAPLPKRASAHDGAPSPAAPPTPDPGAD